MLFQPSNISPDEVNGSGTVDLTNGLNVSWRVSGDSAMTAYQITIYENTAASTQLYTTGEITLSTPFWGVNYAGVTQYYTAEIAADDLSAANVKNGSTYKLLIKQWWSDSDSIEQTTAAVFTGRAAPTVSISAIPAPLAQRFYTFEGTFSQEQGDALKWIRWEIASENADAEVDDVFYDTGYIYGTGELKVYYDGFVTGNYYDIRLTAETVNNEQATTGWVRFEVTYDLPESTTVATAQLTGKGYVVVTWDRIELAMGYTIYRRDVNERTQVRLADVGVTTGELRDYCAISNKTYEYYVWPTGSFAYLTAPAVTNQITVCRNYWAFISATADETGKYEATGMYFFRYGMDGITVAQFSNNSNPTFTQNFTKYPTRQVSSANYLTGSVTGLIGAIGTTREYSDTISQADALRALSTTTDEIFMLDPKGHFLKVHTAAAITSTLDVSKRNMPQTLTVPWVEVGSVENVTIVVTPGGTLWAADAVIFTTLMINPDTGALEWTTPDEYEYGSILSLNDAGQLVQTTDNDYTPATITLDPDTGMVVAQV